MRPIILDVDTGIDDALAICYAIRSQELDVLGLTTCFGNVTVEEATRNSLQVLERLESDVPVIPGAAKPLFREPTRGKTVAIHGEDGLGNTFPPLPIRSALAQHASDFMVDQVKERPHCVTIVCVGALTNLALAVLKEPDIVHLVDRVIIMGGAVTVPGNVTGWAEANIYADPDAAEIVFHSGLPLVLVGLDVTMKTLLLAKELQNWREKNTTLSRFMADVTEFYMGVYTVFYPRLGGCALHDPLAIGVAIDPTFVQTVPMYIQVDTEGSLSLGRTVADRRASNLQPANMEVCLQVDSERFLRHFLERVV
jgi:purine nucleosidase